MIKGSAHRWDRILKIGVLGLIYNGRSIGVITNFAVVKGLRQASVSEYPWMLRWHKETRIIEPQPHYNHYNYCQPPPVLPTPLSYYMRDIPNFMVHHFPLLQQRPIFWLV